ncbi:MAG: FAD-dependent oxidoreductase [Anaerolineae bacterium]|nr:FAD-dependent oxidoreductase [Anaerolineae bacterium]
MPHLLIIGGSDAGVSAALRAQEVNPAWEVTVVVADRYPNYSICGLPFWLGGEVADWRDLAHRKAEDIEGQGIRLLLEHTARAIHPAEKTVTVVDKAGRSQQVLYDSLVIGAGAVPARPPIRGLEQPGVFFLRTMADGFALRDYLEARSPVSAVVVGGGYIGLEMAEALARRGIQVTLVEYLPSVLTTLDPPLGALVGEELNRRGVTVATGVAVEAIDRQGGQLAVIGSGGFRVEADLVLVATGVRPNADLAEAAGVETGRWGAICVSRAMETNVPHVYAAGDCAETYHRLLERDVYMPLGSTAHKQGRVAGENAVGGQAAFAGTLGTQVVKVCDLVAARTGMRDDEAREADFDPLTTQVETWDHKVYYPGAHRLHLRVTGDRRTGRLLGAQIVGHRAAEVSKRVDIFAAALFNEMKVKELNDIDLSYTPPLSTPWDAVQMAAQAWMEGRGNPEVKPC